MTAGELRKALEGFSDEAEVHVYNEGCYEEIQGVMSGGDHHGSLVTYQKRRPDDDVVIDIDYL